LNKVCTVLFVNYMHILTPSWNNGV